MFTSYGFENLVICTFPYIPCRPFSIFQSCALLVFWVFSLPIPVLSSHEIPD